MSEKGYEVLNALVPAHGPSIAAVVSARDPHVQNDFYDEISHLCAAHGIAFHDRGAPPPLTGYALAVSWRWLISIPADRLIVIHDSLLPRYRGYNPLVTALINGDTTIGISAVFGAPAYDTGRIIDQRSVSIAYPIRIQQAVAEIAKLAGQLACRLVETIASNRPLTGVPQDDAAATYSLWRDEIDYLIDWNTPADDVRRFIDAVGFPYRGASAHLKSRLIRVLAAEAVADLAIENRTVGKVMAVDAGRPVIVCARGLLRLDDLVDDETGDSLLPWTRLRSRFE